MHFRQLKNFFTNKMFTQNIAQSIDLEENIIFKMLKLFENEQVVFEIEQFKLGILSGQISSKSTG